MLQSKDATEGIWCAMEMNDILKGLERMFSNSLDPVRPLRHLVYVPKQALCYPKAKAELDGSVLCVVVGNNSGGKFKVMLGRVREVEVDLYMPQSPARRGNTRSAKKREQNNVPVDVMELCEIIQRDLGIQNTYGKRQALVTATVTGFKFECR